MTISSILDELWTEWSSVPFWMNYEQNGHQFHFGWNYEQNGHQFHFGWTMNRMTISSILDELWTQRSSNFCDCTRSILDELWTEQQPSVPFWINYGQNNKHQFHFGWTIGRMVIELPWLHQFPIWMNYRQHGHQFIFGWTMRRMVISSILDELWTSLPSVPFWMKYAQKWSSVPFWMNYGQNDHQFHFGSTGAVIRYSHGGSFVHSLWSHIFILFSNSWSFNPGLKIESGFHTTILQGHHL
jgi:hypothetical protein